MKQQELFEPLICLLFVIICFEEVTSERKKVHECAKIRNVIVKRSTNSGTSLMAANYLNDWKTNENNTGNNDILVYQSKLNLEPITTKYIGSANIFPRDPQCSMVDIFTCCCRQQFSLTKGSIGFIGGVDSSIASMEIFHLYQKLKDILKYISTENRSPMSRGLARNNKCRGGCPYDSFCDSGVCRCHERYQEKYGKCWLRLRDFTRIDWGNRLSLAFNPFIDCTEHRICTDIDMNMICGRTTKKSDVNRKCKCRENMKWNPDVLECQIFIDVNCSSNNGFKNASQNQTVKDLSLPSKPSSTILRKYQIALRNRPISYLSPLVTIERSMLLNLDLTKTTSKIVNSIFCKELTTISRRYRIFKRQRLMKLQNSSRKQSSYIASSKDNIIDRNHYVIILFMTVFLHWF